MTKGKKRKQKRMRERKLERWGKRRKRNGERRKAMVWKKELKNIKGKS